MHKTLNRYHALSAMQSEIIREVCMEGTETESTASNFFMFFFPPSRCSKNIKRVLVQNTLC